MKTSWLVGHKSLLRNYSITYHNPRLTVIMCSDLSGSVAYGNWKTKLKKKVKMARTCSKNGLMEAVQWELKGYNRKLAHSLVLIFAI